MVMTFQDVIRNGLLDALVETHQDPVSAAVLLEKIGFTGPRPHFPTAGDPKAFWVGVCEAIKNGAHAGGFEGLYQGFAETYPYHPKLKPLPPSEPAPSPPTTAPVVNMMVRGWNDVRALLETARAFAAEMGMPLDSVRLELANAEGVLLTLTNWTTEQALPLTDKLRGARPRGSPIEVDVASSEFRDYLISQLFIEGPDQARFAVENVRASTPVRDVAQQVIRTQYDPKVFIDGTGHRHEPVVDRMNEDGKAERLDLDKTLHDHHVRDGDTLHVSPEATAGTINPRVREEALVRARNEVVEYAQTHPGFGVAANAPKAPTEYLFKFRAPSFGPPNRPGEDPVLVQDHEVFLMLPPDFPMKAPQVFWQTPLFHPNVGAKTGKVCLGILEDRYRPGLDFRELCQMLVDMASFLNYALEGNYNEDAKKWAGSPEGQIAIERRGGQSFTRKFLRQFQTSRPVDIRRI